MHFLRQTEKSLYYSKVLSHIFIHNCCRLLPLPLLLVLFLLLVLLIHKDPGEETVLGVEDIQMCKAWSLPEGGLLFICKNNKNYTTERWCGIFCLLHSDPFHTFPLICSVSQGVTSINCRASLPHQLASKDPFRRLDSRESENGSLSALLSAGSICDFPGVPTLVGSCPLQGGL